MHGWCGKVLRVNLSNGTVASEALDPQVARDYIGARGFGIYYLTREVTPDLRPARPARTRSSWPPARSPAPPPRPAPATW